ncbi:MAG: aminodeoxychorismate synthase component I [Campylobacterota bacterium]|nr:aminodeoxychorismate synthase component I [Campylobacterota bacterium]
MKNKSLQQTLNEYGVKKEPCFFCISFDLEDWHVQSLAQLDDDIRFCMDNENSKISNDPLSYDMQTIGFEQYAQQFDEVIENIKSGNTYLLNLSAPSDLKINTVLNDPLKEIYEKADARFKLKYKDEYVCFSPERFINIENNKIYTYPMKGTIDAGILNAQAKILANEKEMAEHTMVVDLLRNDLGIVASNIQVEQFRYIDKIKAGKKELLQVSSQISGELQEDWQDNLGDMLLSLLPAGSITGTPKKKTVELINDIEHYDRGFYTGVFGVFDGQSLDSAVMIRFIEKTKEGLVYKSGGGITLDSTVKSEYQELIDKVYIP